MVKDLANGSVGIITDVIYNPSIEYEVYSKCTPLCILVQFEKYTKPAIYEGLIPIVGYYIFV